MRAITSRQHDIVKTCRAVARGDRARMLLDGWHLLSDAIRADVTVDTIAIAGEVAAAEQRLVDRARAGGAHLLHVSAKVLEALSPVRSPTGVVAIARKPAASLASLQSPAPALILALAGVQDPGNVGAAIRSAAGGGASGVVCDRDCADPFGWKALRASMGSVFHLPVLRTDDVTGALRKWHDAGLTILAATPGGRRSIYDVDWRRPTVILMGSEGAGLSQTLTEAADDRIGIPMRAPVESLNVAVSAALMIFEAQRQR